MNAIKTRAVFGIVGLGLAVAGSLRRARRPPAAVTAARPAALARAARRATRARAAARRHRRRLCLRRARRGAHHRLLGGRHSGRSGRTVPGHRPHGARRRARRAARSSSPSTAACPRRCTRTWASAIPFNACVNASTYTGVKFNISGTADRRAARSSSRSSTSSHSTVANNGTCDRRPRIATRRPRSFSLPATATDVTVLFSEQTGGGAAVGAAPVDPTRDPQHPVADQPGGRHRCRRLHRHGHHRQRHVHLVAPAPRSALNEGPGRLRAGRAFSFCPAVGARRRLTARAIPRKYRAFRPLRV